MPPSSCLACQTPCLPQEKANLGQYDVHTLCLKCKQCDTRLTPQTAYLWPSEVDVSVTDDDPQLYCRQHVPRIIYRRSLQVKDLVRFYDDTPAAAAPGSQPPTPSTPSKASITSSKKKAAAGITKKSMMTGFLSKVSAAKTAVLGLSSAEPRKTSARFKHYKRGLQFRGFVMTKSCDGSTRERNVDAQTVALVGHTTRDERMDDFDIDMATAPDSDEDLPDPEKIESANAPARKAPNNDVFNIFGIPNTRRANADELAKRPRPRNMVFDPLLAASAVKMFGTECAEQYEVSRTLEELINDNEQMDLDKLSENDDHALVQDIIEEVAAASPSSPSAGTWPTDADMEMMEREQEVSLQRKCSGYKETVRRRRDSQAAVKAQARWSVPVTSGETTRSRSTVTIKYNPEAVSLRDIKNHGLIVKRRVAPRRHTSPASGGNSPVGSVRGGDRDAQEKSRDRTRTRTTSSRLSAGRRPLSELTPRDPIADIEGVPQPDNQAGKQAKRPHTTHGEMRDHDVIVKFLSNMLPAEASGQSHDAELDPPRTPIADAIEIFDDPNDDKGENVTLALKDAVQNCLDGMRGGEIGQLVLVYETVPLPAVNDETIAAQ